MMKVNSRRKSSGRMIENIRRSIQRKSIITQPPTEEKQNVREQQMLEPVLEEPMTEIRALYEQVTMEWEGIEIGKRPKISRIDQNKNTKETVQIVNNALEPAFKNAKNFEELCHSVYCAAAVTNIILKTEIENRTQVEHHQQIPPWKERIEKKITNLRREIGVLHAYLNTTNPSKKIKNKIKKFI